MSAVIGACVGLLIGLAVLFDDRAVQRRIEKKALAAAPEANTATPPSQVRVPQSNAIAIAMLVPPLVAGVLIWQRETIELTAHGVSLISFGTILSTAILGHIDLRRLMLRAPGNQAAFPLGLAFVGFLGMWLLVYPLRFLGRRRFGATNLFVPGLVVTAVFMAPTVRDWLSEPVLPSVDSPEVLALVVKIVEDAPMYQARKGEFGKLQVRESTEISFDQERQRRVARVKLISKLGVEEIFYTVEWLDRKKWNFFVQIFDKQP
jgi:hypothetical protein